MSIWTCYTIMHQFFYKSKIDRYDLCVTGCSAAGCIPMGSVCLIENIFVFAQLFLNELFWSLLLQTGFLYYFCLVIVVFTANQVMKLLIISFWLLVCPIKLLCFTSHSSLLLKSIFASIGLHRPPHFSFPSNFFKFSFPCSLLTKLPLTPFLLPFTSTVPCSANRVL